MSKVCGKISNVADETCQDCPQCWEGECRAFCLPHSLAERNHRTHNGRDNGLMNCFPSGRNAAPYREYNVADIPLDRPPHEYLDGHRPLQEVVDGR